MALEAIGATSNSRNYVDVVKSVSKVPQTQVKAPQAQVKTAEETAKKAAPTQTPAATMNIATSPEAKNADNLNAKKEEETTMSSKIKDAVDKVNKRIVPSKTRCEFSYHEETNRISIKVIDQNTEETIKEIPAEETLDMLARIWEFSGLLVDERR